MSSVRELRFEVPLYTVAEAARIVGIPATTLRDWAKGYRRNGRDGRSQVAKGPVVTSLAGRRDSRREATIPFVGLGESMVLAAVRATGVSMQRIRPALEALEQEIGVEHALASRRLYTDGAEILYNFAEPRNQGQAGEVMRLVVARSGQTVFTEVVQDYLRRIEYADDGYPRLISLPGYTTAEVVADPERAFGAPIFLRGGARVDDVLQRFWSGESIAELHEEFGVPEEQLEDALRVASRWAA